jgi:4-carboxymuconolactone decarboxylase
MLGVMSDDERREAMLRVGKDVGWRRIGTEDDAPPLQPLPGGPTASQASARHAIEDEIAAIQGLHGQGEVWGREGLDYRTRCFITLSVLMALYETDELHLHVSNALNVGLTPDEIREALFHGGLYAGVSAWENAAHVAQAVFAQRGVG